MKKVTFVFLILIIINVFAAFDQYSFSCKANSLGGISLVEDDPLAIFLNPANFFVKEKNCFEVSYFKPYSFLEGVDISNSNFIFTTNTKFTSFSLGYSDFSTNKLYEEKLIMFTTSMSLFNFNKKLPKLSFGTNIKFLSRELFLEEEILNEEPQLKNNTKVSNYSYDLALLYKSYKENFAFSITLRDINQPNIGFLEKEKLPFTISFSNKYNFGDLWQFEDLTLFSEIRYRNQEWGSLKEKFYWAFGSEIYLNFNTIALRMGLNKSSFNLGFSYNNLKLYKLKLSIDYSFGLFFSYLEPLNNHNFSLKIGF